MGARSTGERAEQATAGALGDAGGAQARGAGRMAGRAQARGARGERGLGARAGFGLCTRCTRPVFGPVRLGIFPESLNEHCSL